MMEDLLSELKELIIVEISPWKHNMAIFFHEIVAGQGLPSQKTIASDNWLEHEDQFKIWKFLIASEIKDIEQNLVKGILQWTL